MYKFYKKNNKSSINDFFEDCLYGIYFIDDNKYEIVFKNSNVRVLWKYEIDNNSTVEFLQDVFLIINHSEKTTTIFRKGSNDVLMKYNMFLPVGINFPYSTNNHILFFKNKNKLTEINLNSWEVTERDINKDLGYILNVQNKFLFRIYGKGILVVYDNEIKNLIWQRDFSEECKYIDPWNKKEYLGSAQHIYPYEEDKIIVCCKYSYCFCLDVNTGRELWKNDFSSWMTFDYANHIGYSYSNGGSIAKIDLKTGTILNKDGKYHNLPDLPEYKGCYISSNTGTVKYHEGLLYGLVYSNGYSFIVAINPHDWHYEWIHRVETIGKLMDIKFHQSRMYIQDSEGDLHIFEKK